MGSPDTLRLPEVGVADAAVAREGRGAGPAAAAKLAVLRQAIATLGDDRPVQERTVALLEIFARI
jgi:hypothetical protein